MGAVWTREAVDWYEAARRGSKKFLHDLDDQHFAQRAPIICVSCADLLRNYDMVKRIARLRGFADGEDHQTHRLSWHGGIMRIVAGSATNPKPGMDDVFLQEMLEAAYDITGLREFVTYVHWPCGKGLKHGLDIADAAEHLFLARERLKSIDPAFKVKTVFHIDPPQEVGTGKMKSYFAKRDDFVAFRAAA